MSHEISMLFTHVASRGAVPYVACSNGTLLRSAASARVDSGMPYEVVEGHEDPVDMENTYHGEDTLLDEYVAHEEVGVE